MQLRRGLKALGGLLRDPDDTAKFATIVESFQGNSVYRLWDRMSASPEGRRLLQEKPDLLAVLSDHERLRKLPEGTLGRVYLAYCEREGITGQGLAKVIEEGYSKTRREQLTDEQIFLGNWMRDSHDLYHLVTGYQTDLIGELCVLAFTAAQTRNRGVLIPVSVAFSLGLYFRTPGPKLAVQAVGRSLRAAFFPEQDWIALLEKPLGEVRRLLKVGDPPVYEPFYTPGRGPKAVAMA
ncbi:MAG: Coq4 family protein [Bdellovibrionota bacterium]